MSELTADERAAFWEAIEAAFLDTTTYSEAAEKAVETVVAGIAAARVAAALAPVEALADEWEAACPSEDRHRLCKGGRLRAALTAAEPDRAAETEAREA